MKVTITLVIYTDADPSTILELAQEAQKDIVEQVGGTEYENDTSVRYIIERSDEVTTS